jgi:TRAP-type C4-dicarboxylate transport system substrate-binding protein
MISQFSARLHKGGRLAERWKKVAEEVRQSSGGKIKLKVIEQTGLPISALLVDPMQCKESKTSVRKPSVILAETAQVGTCHADGAVWEGWYMVANA